jgi:hypothetical protein
MDFIFLPNLLVGLLLVEQERVPLVTRKNAIHAALFGTAFTVLLIVEITA